jgi:hypothetical protein
MALVQSDKFGQPVPCLRVCCVDSKPPTTSVRVAGIVYICSHRNVWLRLSSASTINRAANFQICSSASADCYPARLSTQLLFILLKPELQVPLLCIQHKCN